MALTPRTLVHNWRLKLTALGLSVFLWALVQTEPRNADTFSPVPVVVELADTAWALSGAPQPAQVELRLSGPAGEIFRLARTGTSVRVPVRAVGSTDTTVILRRDWVVLEEGSGLIVESVSPASVRLGFEAAVSRAVPIAVRTVGDLPPELALASPIGVNPPMARVRGPTSRVNAVDSVRLRTLDLAQIEASGVVEVAVDTVGLTGVRVTPANATVGIRVEERVERTVPGVPVIAQVGSSPEGVTISPEGVDVVLQGARTLVMSVDPMDLRVWIPAEVLAGIAAGEERRVQVRVEGGPELVSISVPDPTVTVRRAAGDDPAGETPVPGAQGGGGG